MKSRCCIADLKVVHGNEGTSYHKCSDCGKPTDFLDTSKPFRVQRKRTKGWKMPKNTIYVGRPSKWGNPFKMFSWIDSFQIKTAKDLVEAYGLYVVSRGMPEYDLAKKELKGKNLACWCPLDQPCHADILLEVAIK